MTVVAKCLKFKSTIRTVKKPRSRLLRLLKLSLRNFFNNFFLFDPHRHHANDNAEAYSLVILYTSFKWHNVPVLDTSRNILSNDSTILLKNADNFAKLEPFVLLAKHVKNYLFNENKHFTTPFGSNLILDKALSSCIIYQAVFYFLLFFFFLML